MIGKSNLRVGVVFGGRSGEHEVSLNSARNVMEALTAAGHRVIPIGISPQGRWLTAGDPLALLCGETAPSAYGNGAGAFGGLANGTVAKEHVWALLPHPSKQEPLPAVDVLFPVLHGTYGEDGTIQGLFEMANLPYVGCGVLASAAGMDKAVAKQLFTHAGLPQLPYMVTTRQWWRSEPSILVEEIEETLGYPLFVKPANLGSSVGISRAGDGLNWQQPSTWPAGMMASSSSRRRCPMCVRSR